MGIDHAPSRKLHNSDMWWEQKCGGLSRNVVQQIVSVPSCSTDVQLAKEARQTKKAVDRWRQRLDQVYSGKQNGRRGCRWLRNEDELDQTRPFITAHLVDCKQQ